jgi:hypothetical protein
VYDAKKNPSTQYPVPQYPSTQYPVPSTQYPVPQYPSTQYPSTQYPVPSTQYPSTPVPHYIINYSVTTLYASRAFSQELQRGTLHAQKGLDENAPEPAGVVQGGPSSPMGVAQ